MNSTDSNNNLPPQGEQSSPGRFGKWCAHRGIYPRGLSVPATLVIFALLLAALLAYAVAPAAAATGIVLLLIAAAVWPLPLIVTRLGYRRERSRSRLATDSYGDSYGVGDEGEGR